MEGGERIRIFCALRLPAEVVESLTAWQLAHVHDARIVPREHRHVTLAFLGHGPVADAQAVVADLRAAAAAARPLRLAVTRYRETRSVGMLPVRTFVPSDAAAYLSRPRPGGAEYEVIESVALGG